MVNFEAFKLHASDENNIDDQMLFLNNRDGVTFWHSRMRKLPSLRECSPQNTYSSYSMYRRTWIAPRLRDWQDAGCCAASLGTHTVCLSVFFFPRQFSLFRQCDLADQNRTSYAYLSAKSYGRELYPRNVQSLKIRTAV